MWTRSAANKETGLMTVVCTDWNGAEFFRGEFSDLREAEEAGANAEREMTNAMNTPAEQIECDLNDEDLLAELFAEEVG